MAAGHTNRQRNSGMAMAPVFKHGWAEFELKQRGAASRCGDQPLVEPASDRRLRTCFQTSTSETDEILSTSTWFPE
jgi:hypothetical protein